MKPDAAQERRRELNRLAAQKLRNRQKERVVNIRQEYFNAQSNNTRLVYEKKQLFKERETLRTSLEAHKRFCQQQTHNLRIGNRVIYLASPNPAAFSQPVFIANVDQCSEEQRKLEMCFGNSQNAVEAVDSSTCDSQNPVEDVDASQDSMSSSEECDGSVENLNYCADDRDTKMSHLVITDVRSSPVKEETVDESHRSLTDASAPKIESTENNCNSNVFIPIMVLESSEI